MSRPKSFSSRPGTILSVQADPSYLAMLAKINPQASTKLVNGHATSVNRMLTVAFDDPTMDDDLRRVLSAHEVVLDSEWPDVW